jgi:MoaA/NifB/PqqE/SkfB family radical SAM enzyme
VTEVAHSLFDQAKGFVSARLLEHLAEAIENGNEKDLSTLFRTISMLAPSRYHRAGFEKMSRMAEENHPFVGVFKRTFQQLHPNVRKKFIANFLVNFVVLGRGIRDREERSRNRHLPNFLVISPTMRCNLRCKGCYASGYGNEAELSFGELDRILTEAKSLGMYFFTFSGGESFLRNDLLDLWAKHGDCFFQVYTNGTLLDDALVDKLVGLGNVAPMVSIEGGPDSTDSRRGVGMHEKIMGTFSRMKRAGLLYGFSATYTRKNAEEITDEGFIDGMISAGCLAGWFFQYIPTGQKPDATLMATPRQRALLHERVEQWRKSKPIFMGDFWNDGPYVDGCMAAGERYLHIIANGDVEPCVFVHFAVDNIHGKALADVLESPFFKAIREKQPYEDDNLLCPCLVIDHPHVLREIVGETNAHPTHPGAESILGELAPDLDRYSKEMKRIFDPIWEKSGREKYLRSLENEDKPEVHARVGRKRTGGSPTIPQPKR